MGRRTPAPWRNERFVVLQVARENVLFYTWVDRPYPRSVLPSPRVLDGARVIAAANLAGARPTGLTRHARDGEPQASCGFAYLALASYDGSGEVYLFYCDADWSILNDTAHDSRA